MKKIYLILIVCLFFYFIPFSVLATNTFIKSNENPVRYYGTSPDWEEIGQFQPTVIHNNVGFNMWYSSLTTTDIQIMHARSIDGYQWSRTGIVPLNNESFNHDPFLFEKDGKLTLFFASSDNGINFRLSKVNLDDNLNIIPTSIKNILTPDQSWNITAISSPHVYYENGKYFLFYSGANNGWSIGLSISNDGETWIACENNPIVVGADGPSLLKDENKYLLMFHKIEGGIDMIETQEPLSCNSQWSERTVILQKGPEVYDQSHLTAPALLKVNDDKYLYYSGLSDQGLWSINLAKSSNVLVTPTITPTQTLTFTPTPIITIKPSPPTKLPIVIIPGLLASWNKNAILHNENVPSLEWKIPHYIKEYEGLKKTLIKTGYKENVNLFIFPYDWRQPVEKSVEDLSIYLNQVIPTDNNHFKINIIGHSLGGLIGRIYAQKNPQLINKIITVGTPHKGVAQSYKLVAAGEIERENTLMWLAEKIIIQLNKNNFETDRDIIEKIMPVAFDLLPTYDYLIDKSGNKVDLSTLSFQNKTLSLWNTSLHQIHDKLKTIAGKKNDTLSGFKISPRTQWDTIMSIYPDGRPMQNLFEDGDKTIILSSAKVGNSPITINGDHRDIIIDKSAIKSILDQLDIKISKEHIIEGSKTDIEHALIFMIQSSVKMKVKHKEKIFTEEDGLVLIPDADKGQYEVLLQGVKKGNYTLHIGTLSEKNEQWQTRQGEITNNIPTEQTDHFLIQYDRKKSGLFIIDSNSVSKLFDSLISKLHVKNLNSIEDNFNKNISDLTQARSFYINKNYDLLKIKLIQVHMSLFDSYKGKSLLKGRELNELISDLEILYASSLTKSKPINSEKLFKIKILVTKTELEWYKYILLIQPWKKDQKQLAFLISLAESKLDLVENDPFKNALYTEILLRSVNELIRLLQT